MDVRLDVIERRLASQEDRMTPLLSLVVRIAERLDGAAPGGSTE
jgi:hypothetical protein